MKKIFTFIFILTLLLGACAPSAKPTAEPVVEEVEAEEIQAEPTALPSDSDVEEDMDDAPSEEPPAFEPVELVDVFGNAITIEEPPTRIISLAPSITETLYAIGAGDLLVGRTDFDNFPKAVLELPSVGGFSADTISMETIIDLEPDLVIGGSTGQKDVIDSLNESGIPSVAFERNSVDGIMDLMLLLGKASGNEEEAVSAVEDMTMRLSEISAIANAIPLNERVTVYYEIWHEPLMTTTNQTFIGEIINLAGGKNIFADLEGDYPAVSAETIIEMNPDVIIGPSSHADELTVTVIETREGWGGLSAIENERIYIIDGDIISRAGPRVIDALEEIAISLYPTYFESY